jgi:hypothetical protein
MHLALEKPATPATLLMVRDLTCNKNRNKGATHPQHLPPSRRQDGFRPNSKLET